MRSITTFILVLVLCSSFDFRPVRAQEDVPTPDPSPIASTTPGTWIPNDTHITDAETWDASAGPFVIQGTLVIEHGGSISIDAGTIVKFASDAGITVMDGSLVAAGSAATPVVFTSLADDAVDGDTNGDGNATDPDAERWSSIRTSDARANVSLSHVRFSYQGSGLSYAACGANVGAFCGDATYSTVLALNTGTMNVSYASFDWTAGIDVTAYSGTFTGDHIAFGPSYDMIHARQDSGGQAPELTIHDSSIDRALTYDSSIWVDLGSPILHLERNWWGTPEGPRNALTTRGNFWNPVAPIITTDDWLTSSDLDAPRSDSNVLFLPGIEGSRLYDENGKLWEPFDLANDNILSLLSGAADARMRSLMLDTSGAGESNIVAKADDTLDTAAGADYYDSFERRLDGLKSSGAIGDWEAAAYDWRFSPAWIVSHGAEEGGAIRYENATDTPYVEQLLRKLAATSKTRKVTVVAHSYGGLVAKALMEKLGDAETARLIDKVVLVGVPQAGTPNAIGGLLFGYGQGISAFQGIARIVSTGAGRELADTLPSAYELLPSRSYFDSVDDPGHPIVSFADSASFERDVAAYGARITTWNTLKSFLANEDGGRTTPAVTDTQSATILQRALLDDAGSSHSSLDAWTPPQGVIAYQIAGWGDQSTLAGVAFVDRPKLGGLLGSAPSFAPITTEDGDGLVAIPSALLMGAGSSTPRYWFDLAAYAKDGANALGHSEELAIPQLQDLVLNIVGNSSALPQYVSTSPPAPIRSGAQLRFTLRGGGALSISDERGRVTGDSAGSINRSIPDSFFGMLGDLEYLIVPKTGTYHLSFVGADVGALLDEENLDDGTSTDTSTTEITDPSTAVTVTDGTLVPDDPPADQPSDVPADAPTDLNADNANAPATGYTDAGSSGGGFVSQSVTIPKAVSASKPAVPKAVKAKAPAKAKTASTKPKTKAPPKANTAQPTPQPAAALSSIPEAVRAVIATLLAEAYALVAALAQLLANLLQHA